MAMQPRHETSLSRLASRSRDGRRRTLAEVVHSCMGMHEYSLSDIERLGEIFLGCATLAGSSRARFEGIEGIEGIG